jgi:hypothetical protein
VSKYGLMAQVDAVEVAYREHRTPGRIVVTERVSEDVHSEPSRKYRER